MINSINSLMTKRIFDIFTSLIALFLFFPFIIFFVLISSFNTGMFGLFIHERIGQNGKVFNLYKIRTMKNIDGINTNVTTLKDSRITKLGGIIRKYKIDELPQLWNILIGDMSFVGPRPEVSEYISLVPEDIKSLFLSVKPGITGPATLKYRNEEVILSCQNNPEEYNKEIIFPDKIVINLEYIKNRSFYKDLYYIIVTILNYKN